MEELDTSTLVQSMSVDMEADLDVAMLASSYQTQALENSAGYIKARKRALDAMSRKLRRRNTGSGNTKNSMTCKFASTHA